MTSHFKHGIMTLGVMGMIVACGGTGDSGPVATESATAQTAGAPWCENGIACVIKVDVDQEITPQMLAAAENALYCSNRGVAMIPLKWQSESDEFKVTRMGIVCPD